MDLGLAGRKAFITGGSRGIGLAIAQALAGEDARVVICGRDAEALARSGLPAVRADVCDPADLGRAVAWAADHLGGLDLLVANAGGSVGGGLARSRRTQQRRPPRFTWPRPSGRNSGRATFA